MPTKMVTGAGIDPLTPLEHGVDATWRLVADPALDGVSGALLQRHARDAGPTGRRSTPTPARACASCRERLTGV